MRGQKYSEDIKEKARALLAVNSNSEYVAKQLEIPVSTIRTWRAQFLAEQGEDSFVELRRKRKEQFVKDAWRDIELASSILHRRLERAAEDEEKLDVLMTEIVLSKDMGLEDKKQLISQLLSLKLMDVGKISTVLGILYDKQALASKDATSVVDTNVKYEDL